MRIPVWRGGQKGITERPEDGAAGGCCFRIQDHLSVSGLLLKAASEGEKLATAQTVSPSGANAKIRSRKMVSIPPKAAGDSGIFYPVFFLPSAPEPRKTTYMVKSIWLLISFYPLNRMLSRLQHSHGII